MSLPNSSTDNQERQPPATGGNGDRNNENSTVLSKMRLRLNPSKEHEPENYQDMELQYDATLLNSLEKYLPPNMLDDPRDEKAKFMQDILNKYLSPGERERDVKLTAYREKIISNYKPQHRELYTMNPTKFFVPAFLKAINDNTEQSFKSIVSEPSPGIFVFEMLQKDFCEALLEEIENFEKQVTRAKVRIMRPNKMNRYGVVLDDFGFETMLDKLMEGFVCPLSRAFFAEFGGSTLDSHHGFIVEYGQNRDVGLGFHVDDSEVTLNVCLGKRFSGGELFFHGTRCEKHVNTEIQSEVTFDYSHAPGQAVLHRGRHRHGSRATTSGHRINLLLWCRSSVFREMKRYKKDFPSWCDECNRQKKERRDSSLATKLDIFKRGGESSA